VAARRLRLAAGAVWAAALLASAIGADARPSDAGRVQAAIVKAVQERMGADASVAVGDLTVSALAPSQGLRAVPEPAARLGHPVAFKLVGTGADRRARVVGHATAILTVDVEHVRMRTLVERGRAIAEDDVAVSDDALPPSLPLRRVPRLREVVGARALASLAAGEVVTAQAVASRPAVRSGDLVRARARAGTAIVVAALTAAQDGVEGAVIRVVNKESRRELRARVVGPGEVEVIR